MYSQLSLLVPGLLFITLLVNFAASAPVSAQHTLRVLGIDETSGAPLLGVNVVLEGTDLDAETSYGGAFDVNLQTSLFDRVSLSLNRTVYLTQL